MSELDEDNELAQLRIQDMVARIAGVNLKDVVRTLTALHLFYWYLGDSDDTYQEVLDTLEADLVDAMTCSADGKVYPLFTKPDEDAVNACNALYANFAATPIAHQGIKDLKEGAHSSLLQELAE